MTGEQAEQILNWLAGNFNEHIDENQRLVWLAGLAVMDEERAMEVAIQFCTSGTWFPKWPDFRAAVHRRQTVVNESWRDLPPEPLETPVWVDVWSWCRWLRDPKEERAFPQQPRPIGDPVLTPQEYEALRAEWEQAGSPRLDIMKTMSGAL